MQARINRLLGTETKESESAALWIIMLLMESWIIVAALMYWWWGIIYLKSALLWWAALVFVTIIPGYLFWKPRGIMLKVNGKLLVPVTGIALLILVIFRFGVVDPTLHRYLYRCTVLMVVVGVVVIGSLIVRIGVYQVFTKETPQKKKWIQISAAILTDLIWIAGIALLLTNIESIF